MRLLTLLAILFIGNSANASTSAEETSEETTDQFEEKDKLKPINKNIFSFNLKADKTVLKPVSRTYGYVPEWGRRHMDNFITNLNEPRTFVNVILQGKPDKALPSFWRFFVNTTMGFGGFNDVASVVGLEYQNQNFSKTLERYGIKNGDYIVLPVIGPSTERNTFGMVADMALNPVGWVAPGVTLIQAPVEGISERNKKDELVEQFYYESFDPYTATRAAYLQNQEFGN